MITMKKWIKKALIAALLLGAVLGNVRTSLAATYYVSLAGDNVNSGAQESPWRTIQYAAGRVTAGDTVRVSSGTYNENVTISADGNSANWINFIASSNNGPVIVRKFSFSGANYVRIKGFEITHVDTAYGQGITFSGSCGHIEILDNYIHNTRFEAIQTLAGSIPHYITIRGNRIDYPGNPGTLAPSMAAIAGVFVTPHKILIEYNHVTRMMDFCDMYGTNVIVRNNSAYWVDTGLWTSLGHPDMFQPGSDGFAVGTRHHVYERNWTGFTTNSHSHFGIWQDTVDAGDTNQLIRGNVAANIGGGGIGNIGTDKMSIYNNSFFNMCHVADGAGLYVAYRYATVGSTLANNIIQNDNSGSDAISIDSSSQILNTHNWGYQAGSESSYRGTSDPLFNSIGVATLDMRLQAGSPCRGIGTDLVRITSAAGSGTSFVVNDSQLLCDGFDIVEGDVIMVGSTRTRITDIDWSANRVTVANSVSWTQNTPVYWGDRGDQRDLGAYPHGAMLLTAATMQRSGSTYTVTPTGDARGVWFYVDDIPTIWDYEAPFTANIPSGTVTAKAYALYAQRIPVVDAISGPGGGGTPPAAPTGVRIEL